MSKVKSEGQKAPAQKRKMKGLIPATPEQAAAAVTAAKAELVPDQAQPVKEECPFTVINAEPFNPTDNKTVANFFAKNAADVDIVAVGSFQQKTFVKPFGRSRASRDLDLKEFSRRLFELMQREEMSPSALAKRIFGEREEGGYMVAKGRDRVHHWLNGRQLPDARNLGLIAERLNCRPEELMPSIAEPEDSAGDFRIESIPGHPGKMRVELKMNLDSAIAFKIAALLEGVK